MPAGEHPGRPVQGLRVLLVEDENLVALLMEDMLAELGHAVARHEPIDAAILDVNINGEEAYPIAEVLAARGIPFFFSTGYGRGSLPAAYRDRPFLQKPFRQQDLERLFTEAFR